jgi:hypothetical protein
MKQSELAMTMSDLYKRVQDEIQKTTDNLYNQFQCPEDYTNEEADRNANLHECMVDYLITSSFNSNFKKNIDDAKKALDNSVFDSDGVPGQITALGESNVFKFSKKQNNDGETTLVVDLLTALARAGVEKAVVDAAMKEATKTKRGNVYYQVTVVED